MDLEDLYDDELPKIGAVAKDVNDKWLFLDRRLQGANAAKITQALQLYRDEVVKRFEDIGFEVDVDITRYWAGLAPEVAIIRRTEPIYFDHEKKAHQVREARQRGGR